MMINVKSSGPVVLTASNVRDDDCDKVAAMLATPPRQRSECVDWLPTIKVRKSTLDGSLTVWASLDPPSTWPHGIYENSRHFSVSLSLDGKIAWHTFVWYKDPHDPNRPCAGVFKARACKVKSLDAFVEKVRAYAENAAFGVPPR